MDESVQDALDACLPLLPRGTILGLAALLPGSPVPVDGGDPRLQWYRVLLDGDEVGAVGIDAAFCYAVAQTAAGEKRAAFRAELHPLRRGVLYVLRRTKSRAATSDPRFVGN